MLNACRKTGCGSVLPIHCHGCPNAAESGAFRLPVGQISFPGGSTEPGDASPIDTALRETEEEIGLARSRVEIIGNLPEYFTGTGYRITPVVGLIKPPFEVAPDPGEVAEIFEVPLAFLMDGMHHQRRTVASPREDQRRTLYTMPYQHFFIWGATAGMLRNLFHFLRS
jgi:8-oxo-dGTP pyrophosphatase MutT (NUDIX family)